MLWLNRMMFRLGVLDRTEVFVALAAVAVVGFFCMRGLSAKLR
ncbi:MAG TPA: hypothetical protein VHY91_03625 [Pirellulales bacterium]|jgi:hypothetical protein|nr:hypothetical protein [Pirellulales bacterium]